MIIDDALYVDGKRQPGPSGAELVSTDGLPPDAFVWLGMRMPSSVEMERAQRRFALPDETVEDALGVHERPKLEFDGDTLFLVLRTARYVTATDEVDSGELCVFVGPWYVLSVRHGTATALDRARAGIDHDPELARLGPGAVLHAICDQVVRDYNVVVDELVKDVREVERDVFSGSRFQPTRRIYFLIREVLDFFVAITPLAGPLNQLAGPAGAKWMNPGIAPLFRDVHDDLLRVIEEVRTPETLLMSALDANQTQVSIRQNEDMRKISAWVGIAAVPTMVVLVLVAVACVLLYRKFKSSGWL